MTTKDERIAAIVAYAYAHAPAFTRLMNRAGLKPADIKGAADLGRIPRTTKDELAAQQAANPPFGGWLTIGPEQLRRIYLSPGTMYAPQGWHDESRRRGYVEAFEALGISEGDRVLNAFSYHTGPYGQTCDDALSAVGATVIPTGPGHSEMQIKVIMDLKANVYIGTPSFLDAIYRKLAEIDLPPERLSLEKAFFTAEPYPPSLRRKFEGEFGLTTGQAYATSDLGVIAYDVEANSGLTIADNLHIEIADPQTGAPLPDGEVGEVVVTTFSETYPLIRLGTDDLSIRSPENGRLVALLGHGGEAIKVRGMFFHPNQLKAAALAFKDIAHSVAVITRINALDVLTLRVELRADSEVDRDEFAERLKKALGERARLRVDAVEFVPPGVIDPSGLPVQDERTEESPP